MTSRIRFGVLFLALAAAAPQPGTAGDVPDGMVLIPAGTYTPLYRSEGTQSVSAFYLDTHPVTNAEFLEFVRVNPAWQRSRVKRLFADESYLRHWAGDLTLGTDPLTNSPVTHVSWFAASAYARWCGKRLPTLAEWEHAGAADDTMNQRILDWYSRPQRAVLPAIGSTTTNAFGVWDLHGLVWEWVWDFNSALVTGESRADSGLERRQFCGAGSLNASDFRDYAGFMRAALRSSLKADYTLANLGFRCARDKEDP